MDPLSDWELPFSQTELEEIEAAIDSAASLLLKRKAISSSTIEIVDNCRRLPNWGTQPPSNSNQNPQCAPRVFKSEAGTSPRSEIENNSLRNASVANSHPWHPYWSGLRPHQDNVKAKLPAITFRGQIVYCTTYSEVEKATLELLKHIEAKQKDMDQFTLGFDIEWRPVFGRKGEDPTKAALMQICGDLSRCYVFHIIHSGIPPILQSLLEDPKFVKVGVCIAGDAYKMLNDYNVHVKPLEDLSWLANQKLDELPRKWSLAALTETITCKELPKPRKIRLGNWELKPLSKDQLEYAATDAFVSWHLHQILKSFSDLPRNKPEEKAVDLKAEMIQPPVEEEAFIFLNIIAEPYIFLFYP